MVGRGSASAAAWVLGVAVVCMAPVDAGQRGAAPVWRHDVVRAYPHDPEAFTQGLVFRDGFLYESTGINGRSSLRRVVLETRQAWCSAWRSDRRYFAEGLASWGPHLVQLTWDTGIGFVYDRPRSSCCDLHLSRARAGGSPTTDAAGDERRHADAAFLDPSTFTVTRRVTVRDGASAGRRAERARDRRRAGLRQRVADRAHRDHRAGRRPGGGLAGSVEADARARLSGDAVLNGIAYDAAGDRLFVTGKMWPEIFEIKVRRR